MSEDKAKGTEAEEPIEEQDVDPIDEIAFQAAHHIPSSEWEQIKRIRREAER